MSLLAVPLRNHQTGNQLGIGESSCSTGTCFFAHLRACQHCSSTRSTRNSEVSQSGICDLLSLCAPHVVAHWYHCSNTKAKKKLFKMLRQYCLHALLNDLVQVQKQNTVIQQIALADHQIIRSAQSSDRQLDQAIGPSVYFCNSLFLFCT